MSHQRNDSLSSNEWDPYGTAEYYYGEGVNKPRTRTYSVVDTQSKHFNDFRMGSIDTLHEVSSLEGSKNPSPAPEIKPKPVVFSERPIPVLFKDTPEEPIPADKPKPAPGTRRPSIVPMYDDSAKTRRASVDASVFRPRKFYIGNIEQTLEELLKNEDTDNNYQITIEDTGPKVLKLGTANSNGYMKLPVKGTYMLSNLLQELTIAKGFGRKEMVLDERRLSENPVARMCRLITTQFWPSLTREVRPDNIMDMAKDTKFKEEYVDEHGETQHKDATYRIYVPHNRPDQYEYFIKIKDEKHEAGLDVQYLPEKIDAQYIKSINNKPGLLALAAHKDDEGNMVNEPYVVPGGRFNELYGWDSYMETIGLLTSADKYPEHLRLARGMTENFIYEIDHYGKILNANRSYYLGRSQPPFLTDMALRVFQATERIFPERKADLLEFLRRAALAATKEYETIWCAEPRLDVESGLSCYHPEGMGVPPETEASHFDAILEPYIAKHGVSKKDFIQMYNDREIIEPELDEYFLHDRAVRESGHDTSYRLEGKAADLATVDLNSLLYKYETDLAEIIRVHFGHLEYNGVKYTHELWSERAQMRKERIMRHMWSDADGIFYDYNVKTREQTGYESATTFWPLWAGVASEEQAKALVENALPKLEEYGGLVAGTLNSRGAVGVQRPSRQWDYPFGWAPHQILAWIGFDRYGYNEVARRLAYRWLYMMTKAFLDYNGVVVEKYNVTNGAKAHKVNAEYGNQGLDFKGVAREGFGWVNASYVFGITFLDVRALRALGTLMKPDEYLRNREKEEARGEK